MELELRTVRHRCYLCTLAWSRAQIPATHEVCARDIASKSVVRAAVGAPIANAPLRLLEIHPPRGLIAASRSSFSRRSGTTQ